MILLLVLPFASRASSTSPSNQSSKMNSMLYQKQFQSNSANMRMTQHFPGQFNPQVKHSVITKPEYDCLYIHPTEPFKY